MFKLGFYTTASPFYGSRIAFWRHHDAVFNKLCQEGLEIHVILPVQGGQKYVDRLYEGDKSVLYPTLRTQNLIFHESPQCDIDLDALYLDDIHTFQDTSVKGNHYNVQQQRDCLYRLIENMVKRNKPIVFSDTDGFCTEILEDQQAEMMTLYETFKDYPKLKITSPFVNQTLVEQLGDRFYMIPFEVDPNMFQPIRPKSQRKYLLRYVGNYYYREHFIPIFDKLSRIGNVKVNGAGWGPYRHLAPYVDWSPKIMMTPENVNQVYGDSVLGLTGRSSYNAKKGQEIYLYRWKEYLMAGTMIVPEDLPSYKKVLPEGMTTRHILEMNLSDLRRALDMTDAQYEKIVDLQRQVATEFFGVDKWVPVFKEMFEM